MTMLQRNFVSLCTLRAASLLSILGLSACSLLHAPAAGPPSFYSLDAVPSQPATVRPLVPKKPLPTLLINPPHAASGFDHQRMIYLREPHKLEYFARSEWVDTPARMLGPLLVSAIAQSGTFGAVVLSPASASGSYRLDTEIIRLQHNFQTQPSRVQLTLRAYLLDDKTRRVLAWKEFEAEAPAASESAQGGAHAASMAVQSVLDQLTQFLIASQK